MSEIFQCYFICIDFIILKIGKHASCGAIVLYCLNLPPHLRYLPENTFIVGLTPPPHAPDMITISHIIEPLIDSVLKYATPPAQHLPTF